MSNVWLAGYSAPAPPQSATAVGDNIFSVRASQWPGAAPERGALLFVSRNDAPGYRWLGFVVEAAALGEGGELSYEIATSRSANETVAPETHGLHTPAISLTIPLHRALPIVADYDSGREVQRSIGGAIYATRIRAATLAESFRYDNLPRALYDDVLGWFAEYGAEPFYWIDERGRAACAQILDSHLERQDAHGLRDRASLALRLALLDIEEPA